MPLSIRYISKCIFSGQVAITHFFLEQTEENRRDFGTADVPLGANVAVRVTDHIGVVVVAVEYIRHTGCFPACINGLIAGHLDAADLFGQFLIRIPSGESIAFTDRDLVQRHNRTGGIALILVSCAAVGLVVQRVLGCMAAASTATGAIFGIGKGCGYGSIFHDTAAGIGARCGIAILIRFRFAHCVSNPCGQVCGGFALAVFQNEGCDSIGKSHLTKCAVDAGIAERHGEVERLRGISVVPGYSLGNGQIAVRRRPTTVKNRIRIQNRTVHIRHRA